MKLDFLKRVFYFILKVEQSSIFNSLLFYTRGCKCLRKIEHLLKPRCLFCIHCKEKVAQGGDDVNYFYIRQAHCAKGHFEFVRESTMCQRDASECPDYDDDGIMLPDLKLQFQQNRKAINFKDLDYYYQHHVNAENIKHAVHFIHHRRPTGGRR